MAGVSADPSPIFDLARRREPRRVPVSGLGARSVPDVEPVASLVDPEPDVAIDCGGGGGGGGEIDGVGAEERSDAGGDVAAVAVSPGGGA